MGCGTVYKDAISNCTAFIRVNALLQPATPYEWMITDKFGKEYTGQSITNVNGFFDIQLIDLPDGFFTPYSGVFKLEILHEDCGIMDFLVAEKVSAIEFDVVGGTRVKMDLGCPFDCNAGSPAEGNSGIIAFNNAAIVAIPWTSLLKSIYGNTPTLTIYHEISPDVYQDVTSGVTITVQGGPYDPTEFDIDNGGPASGYVLIKA
jgi:hypothetical protein